MFNFEDFYTILEGLFYNVLITFVSCIFPLMIGALISFFASLNSKVEKVFSWLSLPLEAICPILFVTSIYYGIGWLLDISISNYIIAMIAFSICFIGYMPARYNSGYSLLKNILYNGLGLISCIFKWTFCLSFIGVGELTMVSGRLFARYFSLIPYLIAFFIAAFLIFILEAGKRLVKQFMK